MPVPSLTSTLGVGIPEKTVFPRGLLARTNTDPGSELQKCLDLTAAKWWARPDDAVVRQGGCQTGAMMTEQLFAGGSNEHGQLACSACVLPGSRKLVGVRSLTKEEAAEAAAAARQARADAAERKKEDEIHAARAAANALLKEEPDGADANVHDVAVTGEVRAVATADAGPVGWSVGADSTSADPEAPDRIAPRDLFAAGGQLPLCVAAGAGSGFSILIVADPSQPASTAAPQRDDPGGCVPTSMFGCGLVGQGRLGLGHEQIMSVQKERRQSEEAICECAVRDGAGTDLGQRCGGKCRRARAGKSLSVQRLVPVGGLPGAVFVQTVCARIRQHPRTADSFSRALLYPRAF